MGWFFCQSVRRNYRIALFVGAGLALISLVFAATFQDFKDQLGQFINMVPAGMSAVIGDMALGNTPEGWLALELFPLFVPLSLAIVGIVLGAGLIGREEDSGTLELLLASGRSRLQIGGEKWLALAVLLAIPPAVLWLAVSLESLIFDFHPALSSVLAACVSAWLLGLAYGGISFAAQAVTGRRGLALGAGALFFGATYALTVVSKLIDSWRDFDVWSPFYYYNIPETLISGIDWAKLFVLIIVAIIGLVVALVGFRRRDTAI